jgi:hypothetical protein
MRKKGGQRLMEMSQRKSAPVVEEVNTVKRYTDSDRFKTPLAESLEEYDADQFVSPPAPKRDDFITRMFPRLTQAANLLGEIKANVQEKYTESELKKLDQSILDDVLVKQLADVENMLSLDKLPKNLAPVQRRIDKKKVIGVLTPKDEKSGSDEILKRLTANRTKSANPEARKAEKLAEIADTPTGEEEIKDYGKFVKTEEEVLADLEKVEVPIKAFTHDFELEAILPQLGLEMPNKKTLGELRELAKAYEEFSGEVRTPLQIWVSINHPEMDQDLHDWIADTP